jgi:antitoxin (DNA-binding transcriptional repressor) of toxin-antitoxin stability system
MKNRRISFTEARTKVSEYLRRVEADESIVIHCNLEITRDRAI